LQFLLPLYMVTQNKFLIFLYLRGFVIINHWTKSDN
jgi:hypothetical protein